MKSLKQFAVAASFAALACAGMHAQNAGMRVSIPFDFHAGEKLMPAGQYFIQEQGPWVILRTADGDKHPAALMTNGVFGADSFRGARLDFHRYGSAYFLNAIWNSSRNGREVPPTAGENELAKNSRAQPVVVLASNK
jgi:hypothetical protein